MSLAREIIKIASEKSFKIVTAESCTGGMISAALTGIAGSSVAFDRSFITYSNNSKIELLNVGTDILSQKGAVSEDTVKAMARGAILHSNPKEKLIAVSVSGVAGPGGGSEDKPVGTVWFGLATYQSKKIKLKSEIQYFDGDRNTIRSLATENALKMIYTELVNQ